MSGLSVPTLLKPLVDPVERLVDTVQWRRRIVRFHGWHKAEAQTKYDNVVAYYPDRAVSPALQREITEHARERWGSEIYAPWLITYAAAQGRFRPNCVPDNYVVAYMLKNVIGAWFDKLGRTRQRRVLDTALIPEILYCEQGQLWTPEGDVVPPDRAASVIFEQDGQAVLKLARSNQGQGVTLLERESFHPEMLPLERDFVIQRKLRQDPEMDLFCVGGTTVRVTTVITPKGAETRELRVKFSRGGAQFFQSANGISVYADHETGDFRAMGWDDNWNPQACHPDTQELFAGHRLARAQEIQRTCEMLHEKVPGAAWLGWDICPMANGEFAIMEVNCGHSNIKFVEAVQGPNFEDMGWETLHLKHPLWPWRER